MCAMQHDANTELIMRVPAERPGRRCLHRNHTWQPANTGRESVGTHALGHSVLLDWKSMANSLQPMRMEKHQGG
uniref:Uncharacterized protein n=1 Tax=Ralstonia solanacearum CFBP2957 TaxID=859656 RepID=D8P3S0_RALSL|nr:protein of unknown function [Ralstonia solanacearum CFBP2957]